MVIGIESVSAFLKSSPNALSIALLALASPNSPTRSCGCCAETRLTAASIGSIASFVALSSPLTSNWTRTVFPSGLIWPPLPFANGESTFLTVLKPDTAFTVPATAARRSASR